jgi:KDO2-lipid IV(A) lauroyltransferase
MAYRFSGDPKRIPRENIRSTVGRYWTDAQVESVLCMSFENLGMVMLEFLHAAHHPGAFLARFDVSGLEHLDQALARGRGVILVSGHMSNWEVHGGFFGLTGYPIHAMYKRLANPWTERWILDTRRAMGMKLVSTREWKEGTRAVLESGGVLGIVSDQDAGRSGIFIDFLNQAASTFVGPAVLSLRYGVPLIATHMHRLDGGRWQITIPPPLGIDATGDREADVAALTTAWVRSLEQTIRDRPEEYFWFHRRWKTRPLA